MTDPDDRVPGSGRDGARWRALFESRPVARLATVGATHPHIVPITFALVGDSIITAVDHKPKRTTELTRLSNIARDPRVSVLVDRYDDDWDRLWWVRADGTATVLRDPAESAHLIDALVRVYAQYEIARPGGPVISIHVTRWAGWTAGRE